MGLGTCILRATFPGPTIPCATLSPLRKCRQVLLHISVLEENAMICTQKCMPNGKTPATRKSASFVEGNQIMTCQFWGVQGVAWRKRCFTLWLALSLSVQNRPFMARECVHGANDGAPFSARHQAACSRTPLAVLFWKGSRTSVLCKSPATN